MKGRPPKPTAKKRLEGNPGKRPLNEDEPQPKRGIPDIPEWLKMFPRAIDNWEFESKILDDQGTMTEAERGILAYRCYAYARWVQLALDLLEEGEVLVVPKIDLNTGVEYMDKKHNPKQKQLESMMKEYKSAGSLLALDTVSRARVKTIPKEKESKFDRFMQKKGLEVVK